MSRPSPLPLFAVVLLAVSILGCSSTEGPASGSERPPPDPIQANTATPEAPGGTQVPPGAGGSGPGAPNSSGPLAPLPPVTEPPRCQRDDDCAGRAGGLRCETETGACVPAQRCGDDSNCSDTIEGAEYCQGPGCRCVKEGADTTGVCRRRLGVCEACTDDSQCGSGPTFEPRGACKALPGDTSGTKYCFRLQEGPSCECGYVNDGTGYCRPASNQCTGTGCVGDADCSSGEACNAVTCLCESQCRWDFQTQKEVPACPGGQTCWVDQANLNPTSKSFGLGRCRPPCTGDAQCADLNSNPYGGPDLVCATEEVGEAGASLARCRPSGECMDDLECPVQALGSPQKGYCDRSTRACMTDCRLGTDPLTGRPFQDCRAGFGCQTQNGVNRCVEQGCAELGGQHLACGNAFDLCCGADWNGDGLAAAESASCSGTAGKAGCFAAPADTFCKPCQGPQDCGAIVGPAGSSLPNLCMGFADPVSMTTVGACLVATQNDFTRDPSGVLKASLGCPKGFTATPYPLILNPDYAADERRDLCKSDADCSVGHAKGVCGVDPAAPKNEDGTSPRSCLCDDAGTMLCPNDASAGVTSVCKAGKGVRSCLQSVVCVPDPVLIVGDGETTAGCLAR